MSNTNAIEPETITIVEGPPPEFKPMPDLWPLSIYENIEPYHLAVCQMRTFNGPKLLGRCQRAWSQSRPVRLDFPDGTGMRKQLNVVAARWTEVEEGHVLHLWVQLPVQPPEA
jgi:hypothetical protein